MPFLQTQEPGLLPNQQVLHLRTFRNQNCRLPIRHLLMQAMDVQRVDHNAVADLDCVHGIQVFRRIGAEDVAADASNFLILSKLVPACFLPFVNLDKSGPD